MVYQTFRRENVIQKKKSSLLLPVGSLVFIIIICFMVINQKKFFWNTLRSYLSFSLSEFFDLAVSENWWDILRKRIVAGIQQILIIFSVEILTFYILIFFFFFLLFRKRKTLGWSLEDKLIFVGIITLTTSLTLFIILTSLSTINMYNSVQSSLDSMNSFDRNELNNRIDQLTNNFLINFSKNQNNIIGMVNKLIIICKEFQLLVHNNKDLFTIFETLQMWYHSLEVEKFISELGGLLGGAFVITGSALSIIHYSQLDVL